MLLYEEMTGTSMLESGTFCLSLAAYVVVWGMFRKKMDVRLVANKFYRSRLKPSYRMCSSQHLFIADRFVLRTTRHLYNERGSNGRCF